MSISSAIRNAATTTLATLALTLAGCGGGGGGPGIPTPTLPSGAVVITIDNAEAIALAALDSGDNLAMGTAARAENSGTLTPQDSITLIANLILNQDRSSSSVATGTSEALPCISGTGTDSFSGSETSGSGTVRFANCDLGGVTFNGYFVYKFSFKDPVVSISGGGNLSFSIPIESLNFSMVMNFSETINFDPDNDVNTTDISFSSSSNFAVTGLPSPPGDFLVNTTIPFTGSFDTGLTSGQLIVYGGDGTKVRITVASPYTATVDFDDGSSAWVPVAGSPITI